MIVITTFSNIKVTVIFAIMAAALATERGDSSEKRKEWLDRREKKNLSRV